MKDPTQPGALVTLRDAASLIGVSRQGAYHIANSDPDFPPPLDLIGAGQQRQPVFWRGDIEAFVAARMEKAKAAA